MKTTDFTFHDLRLQQTNFTFVDMAGSCHTNWQLTSLFDELNFPYPNAHSHEQTKGTLSPRIKKALETWDVIKNDNPTLNNEAVIDLVA